MYICVINNSGETVFHKNMECSRDNLELVTNTFGKDIVVGVECIFTWYWVARFLCGAWNRFRAGTCLLHEVNPRRKNKKR